MTRRDAKTTTLVSLEEIRKREQASDRYHCAVTRLNGDRRTYRIKGRVSFGRHPSSIVVLTDPTASRHHASIVLSESSCVLTTGEGVTRTMVNGTKITGSHPLHDGDVVRLGREEDFSVSLIRGAEEDVTSEVYRRALVDESLDVYKPEYLSQWLQAEMRAAKQFLYPLSIVALEVHCDDITDNAKELQLAGRALRELANSIRAVVGSRVVIARYDARTLFLACRQMELSKAAGLGEALDYALPRSTETKGGEIQLRVTMAIAASEPMSQREHEQLRDVALTALKEESPPPGKRVIVVPNV